MVHAPPLAYGFINVVELRRGDCGAARKQASGRTRAPQCTTPVWGTLHWGSPAGPSTSVPSGVVESPSTWHDDLAWWRPAPRPWREAGAHGVLPATGAGVDLESARHDGAGERHAAASSPAAPGAPGPLPAAPPHSQETWRCILAMELWRRVCVRRAASSARAAQAAGVSAARERPHGGCLRGHAHP